MITREQLEAVVQRKKVGEVFNWFNDHFVCSTKQDYVAKCPFLIVQGPSGCGKTTTLRCVAKELRIPIKEYSDTTDTTAISYEINQNKGEEDRSWDRRRASKFEHFVFDNLRFNPLFTSTSDDQSLARADSEFDDSDDEPPTQATQPKQPDISGIIILVESSLMFAKSQKIFIASMVKTIKMIRAMSQSTPRRIAIVFETLESNKDILSLPTRFKQAINMQIIKFNPIVRANMRKFIDMMLRKYQNVTIDKDTIDALITDCDGDLQACINTLEIIRDNSNNYNNVFMGLNHDNNLSQSVRAYQVNKRQRLNPDRFKLNQSLMRDVTKSLGFFHNLGKIFYQKRLYPVPSNGNNVKIAVKSSIDRPYLTENNTEYLVGQLDAEPKKLMPWLHQHYHKFCKDQNIERAALFLDNLSDVDTISMNSIQSSQFYEMHGPSDQIQLYLAVSSTVYSLYADQSETSKSSHKKITDKNGSSYILKTSVESAQNGTGELFSFNKPVSLSLQKVIEDHQVILDHCLAELMKYNINCVDASKILIDYIPYVGAISDNWSELASRPKSNSHNDLTPAICADSKTMRMIKVLRTLECSPSVDYDNQHESLLEFLEDLEHKPGKRRSSETQMDLS